MTKDVQPGPERQQSPVDPSDTSFEYSTFTYIEHLDEHADIDVPTIATENDDSGPVVIRRGNWIIGPGKVAVIEIIHTSRPFLGDATRPIPDMIARLTVKDSLGGTKRTNTQGHAFTEGSIESVEITASSGSVAVITPAGERILVPQSAALMTLEQFYDKYHIKHPDA